MSVRLVDEVGAAVTPGTPGEIEVRGPGVFREYWNRPQDTREASRDGWLRTGDVAVVENGSYRILGRKNVDIIKTGRFKVSALEIEEALREHPDVAECAVVSEALREWARERLATYKVPSRVLVVAELPKNAMGRVTKREVARLFTA